MPQSLTWGIPDALDCSIEPTRLATRRPMPGGTEAETESQPLLANSTRHMATYVREYTASAGLGQLLGLAPQAPRLDMTRGVCFESGRTTSVGRTEWHMPGTVGPSDMLGTRRAHTRDSSRRSGRPQTSAHRRGRRSCDTGRQSFPGRIVGPSARVRIRPELLAFAGFSQ